MFFHWNPWICGHSACPKGLHRHLTARVSNCLSSHWSLNRRRYKLLCFSSVIKLFIAANESCPCISAILVQRSTGVIPTIRYLIIACRCKIIFLSLHSCIDFICIFSSMLSYPSSEFSVLITSFCCCMLLFCCLVESIFNIASDYCMCRLVSAVQSWVSCIQLNRVFYFIQGDCSVASSVTEWVRRKAGKYFSWKWHNICSQMWKDHRISFSLTLLFPFNRG